ncbi:hypothetical protein [Caenimonas soli]|uniref:hypothetical protein n=1 Tax=Caenimonas soli TaxID=2735555 RepID=UPI001556F032|nr:hypothetical protein [Caenimonas soli]NPC57189.1 hypothetical protein [Caenimonas soli]
MSYDIWDTVLRRTCHPDAIKLECARLLLRALGPSAKPHLKDPWIVLRTRQRVEAAIGAETRVKGLDDEYVLEDVLRRLLSEVARADCPIAPAVAERLIEIELELERQSIYLDPSIFSVMDADGADRRIYISDFYMPKPQLEQLLAAVGADRRFHGGYVSCDVSLNKRSGRLFPHVLQLEGVQAASLAHKGDNPYSDVEVPARLGIQVEHFEPPNEHSLRRKRETAFHERRAQVQGFKDEVGRLVKVHADAGDERTLLDVSTLLLGYATCIVEQVAALGVERVFFFTREGEFFSQLYDIARRHSPLRHLLPEPTLLEVSRVATFGPSLRDLSAQELMRLWNLYSSQTPRAFLRSLGLEDQVALNVLERHNLAPDESVQYPWQDAKFLAFLKDPDFADVASSELARRKQLLIDYCAAKGLTQDLASCVVVDIGWRGTIQDNLAEAFPSVQFHGIYLALDRVLNRQPANATKVAFGPDLNTGASNELGRLLRCVAPIEMLCNSPSGSVTGYHRDPLTGAVNATRLRDPHEDMVYQRFTGNLQRRVLEVLDQSLAANPHARVAADELLPHAMAAWSRLIYEPEKSFASAFFSLRHNESFGVGRFVDKQRRLPMLWPLKLLLSKGYSKSFVSALNELSWPHGYAVQAEDRYLIPVLKTFYPHRY